MSALRFIFSLIDHMSGPARRMRDALNSVDRQLERTRINFQRLYESTSGIRSLTMGLMAAGAGVGSALLYYTGRAAIGAAVFKETAFATFEVMLGSRKEAERMFNEAVRFAAVTPFNTQQVVESYQKLLTAGFKPVEIPFVLSGIGDLSAVKGFTPEAVSRITLAISQMKGAGRVLGGELRQLSEAGFNVDSFYNNLAVKLGTTEEKVRAIQAAGKLTADLGIWGILKTVKEGLGGGELGGMMKRQADTLFGLWSTLQSRPFEMFADLDESKGMSKLKTVIKNLNAALDTSTATGKRVKAAFLDLFSSIMSTIFGPLGDATKGNGLEVWLNRLSAGVRATKATFDKYFPVVVGFIKGLGAGVGAVVMPILDFARSLGIVQGATGGGAESVGRLIGQIMSLAAVFAFLLVPVNLAVKGFQTMVAVVNMVQGIINFVNWMKTTTLWSTLAARAAGLWARTVAIGSTIAGQAMTAYAAAARLASVGMAAIRAGATGAVLWFRGITAAIGTTVLSLFRLAGAWLVGLGPVGWVIAAVIAIGGALVWAYNKFDWFRNGVNAVWDWLKGVGASALDFGAMLVKGLVDGIVSGWNALKSAVTGMADSIIGWFKGILGIASPSKVFSEFGENIGEGLTRGIDRKIGAVEAASIKISTAALPNTGGGLSGLSFADPQLKAAGILPVGSNPVGSGAGSLGTMDLAGGAIARGALEGVTAGWAEAMPGYCSRFVRQVFDKVLGPQTSKLFGSSAIQTEKNWKNAGLTRTLDQIGGIGGLKAGDVLFQGFGSGGYGHTAVYLGNGKIAENSTRGKGGKMITDLSQFGKITSVGRYSLGLPGGGQGVAMPAVAPTTVKAVPKATVKPVTTPAVKTVPKTTVKPVTTPAVKAVPKTTTPVSVTPPPAMPTPKGPAIVQSTPTPAPANGRPAPQISITVNIDNARPGMSKAEKDEIYTLSKRGGYEGAILALESIAQEGGL